MEISEGEGGGVENLRKKEEDVSKREEEWGS